jgi:Fic family protein
MLWNWEQPEWPNFSWDRARLAQSEDRFLFGAGVLIGTAKHLSEDDRNQFTVEGMIGSAETNNRLRGIPHR